MSSPMGPPVVPGFSLRVQLFAPNAYKAGDKPIRCFRVVTSPDVTIRDFCEEASRIHEVNYGQPITIKKCQDDQEFDVTQSEVVGNLFASAATIRVIQASSTVSIRDSVPPDSALRYDPALLSNSKKRRKRGSGVQANGALSPAFISNKRQRLSNVDPDMPIPSSESDLGSSQGGHSAVTIPDSQQNTGRPGFIRSEIPATVSPPPYPTLLHSIEKRPTNQTRHKPVTASKSSAQSVVAPGSPSRPVAPASAPTKSKSTSYHIERATERGTSVSTAATSPLSADQQFPPHNQSTLTAQSRLSGPLSSVRSNGQPGPNQRNNQTVYDVDEIESDSASSSAILDKTKALLKTKKSPLNGRPQHEKANEFNTPPPGYRRNSYFGDQTSTPELPPTPSSKQREEKQQRHDGAEKYRNAAAEAAKQRFRDVSEQKKREAEEACKAEQAKIAELVRLKKEEQERVTADKRAAVAATAARLEKERIEKMKSERKAEEDRLAKKKLAEEERLKKAKEQVEGLEKEKNAGIEKQKNSEDKMRRDKAKAEAEAKIERLRKDQEQKRKAEAAAAEESRNAMEQALAEKTPTEKRKLSSASLESSKSGSRTGLSPAPRPQSSTPFIPSGKKSALKSSQAILPSSSAPREPPSDVSMTSSQITPTGGQRRVSFNHEVTRIMLSVEDQDSTNLRKAKQTPIKPPIKDQKPSKLQEVPPEKQTYTRILPPGNNFSKAISTTPILPPKKSTSSITPPTSITPKVIVKSASPIPAPTSKNSESQGSSAAKGKSNEAQVAVVLESGENSSSEGSDSDDHDSDETNPAKILNSAIRPSTLSPKTAAKLEPGLQEQGNQEQEDDIEMGSGQSTPPETRSPVIFNRQPAGLAPVPALELSKAAGEDEEEIQSASDASSSDGGSDNSSADEDEEDDGDEDEEMDGQESEDLSRSQASSQPNVLADKRTWRKFQSSPSLSDKESTTQDAVDYQLTSSIYEANTSSPKKTMSKNKSETASARPNSQRPKFKIGASLQDLNAAQGMAERNRASTQQTLNENRSLKLIGDEDSGSESEIESGEDTDSESDDEGAASKALEVQLSQAQSIPLPDSDEDSSSDSDSDNEEQFREKMKNELVADLARMVQRSGSQRSATSMSSSRIGGQDKSRIAGKDIVKEEKKKREKKYLTGYTFSQVK